MEQSDTAPGQPTVQEGGAKAMLGDASKLQGNHPAASHQTHQQRNAVVKEEEKRKSNKIPVSNQRRKLLLPFLQHSFKTKDLIRRNPCSHGMSKKGTE